MPIDLGQLRTFVAVAEEQHLTRAAERLHLSQSAASSHVRAIEEALDVLLFERTKRSMELTPAGEMLLRQAKSLLNEEAVFTSRAREVRGKVQGHLVVGASNDPASRIGETVAALISKYPLITIDIRGRASAGARQALKTGELDLAILLSQPVDAGFTYYQLGMVQFRIAGPRTWKDKIEKAGWSDLAALPWITPSNSHLAYSIMLGRLFGDKGLELNSTVGFDNAAIARSLVRAGVGMLLMREEHALHGEREGKLAVSPIGKTEYPVLMSHVTSRGRDPLIRAFVEAAGAAWPDMALVAGP